MQGQGNKGKNILSTIVDTRPYSVRRDNAERRTTQQVEGTTKPKMVFSPFNIK